MTTTMTTVNTKAMKTSKPATAQRIATANRATANRATVRAARTTRQGNLRKATTRKKTSVNAGTLGKVNLSRTSTSFAKSSATPAQNPNTACTSSTIPLIFPRAHYHQPTQMRDLSPSVPCWRDVGRPGPHGRGAWHGVLLCLRHEAGRNEAHYIRPHGKGPAHPSSGASPTVHRPRHKRQ